MTEQERERIRQAAIEQAQRLPPRDEATARQIAQILAAAIRDSDLREAAAAGSAK